MCDKETNIEKRIREAEEAWESWNRSFWALTLAEHKAKNAVVEVQVTGAHLRDEIDKLLKSLPSEDSGILDKITEVVEAYHDGLDPKDAMEDISKLVLKREKKMGKATKEYNRWALEWAFKRALNKSDTIVWYLFPEKLFDRVKAIGEKPLSYPIVKPLGTLALDIHIPKEASTGAIRLLGMLAEEGYVLKEEAHPVLLNILHEGDEVCRYYAVQAFWQGLIVEGLDDLIEWMSHEESHRVRNVLKRAVDVLKRRRDNMKKKGEKK